MYNSYEEYMQSVLGLNMPNTYRQDEAMYYGDMQMQMSDTNLLEVNMLYPDIYRIVYPMVQKACSRVNRGMLNEVQINQMVEEVYQAIEPADGGVQGNDNSNSLRNGDVKNPRAKETRRPNNNYLLRDLIKILIIRELLQGGNNMPGMPRPPMGGMPGGPGMPGTGGRPPRFTGMY